MQSQDAFGITAMYEAVRMGHAEVIQVLKEHDAKLGSGQERLRCKEGEQNAPIFTCLYCLLCCWCPCRLGTDEAKTVGVITEAVIAGDLPQLRSLLDIGA
eukprot:1155952-Pelagomonas_calceolata.AAC.1